MRWTEACTGALFCSGLAFALLPLGAQQTAPAPNPAPPAQPSPSMPQPSMPPPGPAPAPVNVAPRFLVVLDAAHGGDDTGARITDQLLEKDITLSLSIRLRSTLSAHGIGVVTTRESDVNLSATSRAERANGAPAAACILLHATATGSGVHLYTSSLAPTPVTRFMPWQTAQSGYITQSLKLSSEIDSALAHAEIPVTLGRTALRPMDSFACPTVAVEVAPLVAGSSTKGKPLSDAAYQRSILDALTAAIDEWRNDWKQQP